MKNLRPQIILLLILLSTINLWFASKSEIGTILQYPLKSLSQITALVGTVFIGIEMFLIGRYKILEDLVAPLDKIYKYHRFLSVFGLIALITHATSLIVNVLPNTLTAQIYIIPGKVDLTYTAGILALYLMILSLCITFYLKVKYQTWKAIHGIVTFSTIFAAFHILTITSDISNSVLLKVWVLGWFGLGLAAAIYKVIFYKLISRKYSYKIEDVVIGNNVAYITMSPLSRRLKYKAGQFAYFTFYSNALNTEEHPFSLVSSPEDDYLKIAIKNLGDFTSNASQLKSGDLVDIRGPYGELGEDLGNFHSEIWLAAGIGITPFLSMSTPANTTLYYCIKNLNDASFSPDLRQKFQNLSNGSKLIEHTSETFGYLQPKAVWDQIKDKNTCVRICGPKSFMESFSKYFQDNNFPTDNIFYEDFNLLD